MNTKTAYACLAFCLIFCFSLQISAQHNVDSPFKKDSSISADQLKIGIWLQEEVKPFLFKQLWEDPKNHQQLSIKNWYFDSETNKYQLDLVLHWMDRWSDAPMAIEGKIEFSYPANGDAIFRTIGKTKNLIELEQIRETRVPGMLALKES